MADVFRWLSYRTIWRTFDSCNNYAMPGSVHTACRDIRYWYGDREERERRGDIRYIRKIFPQTVFEPMEDLGHAGMVLQRPEGCAQRLRELIDGAGQMGE